MNAMNLVDLANNEMWVAWAKELRNGKPTKVPKNPATGGNAMVPTNPKTYGTRAAAEQCWLEIKQKIATGGIGIVLRELPDGNYLVGIDLDSCRDADVIADWAEEVIERFDTYAEISPSGTGVKLFFVMSAEDFAKLRALLGCNTEGKQLTRKTFAIGEHREVAIDTARFYAVTDQRLKDSPEHLRLVPFKDVAWFIEEVGPSYKRRAGNGSTDGYEAAADEQSSGRDESGSGHGFRFMQDCHANGMSYEQAREAILADEDEAGEWANRVDERQLRRAWTNSKPQAEDPAEPPPPCSLDDVHKVFRKWLGDDYDLGALNATLATTASERLTGDPLWLLIISGPGAAKTETAQSLAGAGAHIISTIASEGALLSASPKKSRSKTATGGLLRKIGERGTLVIKDVTSILSADRNTRASVLAAIREIHDGHWSRNVGTDGGQTLEWVGRIVIVGAVTTAWDTAHAVVAAMGDRFVLVRIDSKLGRMQSGKRAIHNTGSEMQMRDELAAAVGGLITHASADEVMLTEDEIERLLKAADIVTRARTAIERDYQGNVVDAHAPEMPTRFAKQLTQMVRGGVAIGMEREAAMKLAIRCARDSIPPLRLEILRDVAIYPDTRPGDVRKRINKPWRTTMREMEALHMLGILECEEETQEVEAEDKSGSKKEKTKWLYNLSEDFDRATLLAMTGGIDPFEACDAEPRQGRTTPSKSGLWQHADDEPKPRGVRF